MAARGNAGAWHGAGPAPCQQAGERHCAAAIANENRTRRTPCGLKDLGGRAWGMGSRLILSNAQKSAGTHTPHSASDAAGLQRYQPFRRGACPESGSLESGLSPHLDDVPIWPLLSCHVPIELVSVGPLRHNIRVHQESGNDLVRCIAQNKGRTHWTSRTSDPHTVAIP